MESYLDTIKRMQIDHSIDTILQRVSPYSTYEDYLHQRRIKKDIQVSKKDYAPVRWTETKVSADPPTSTLSSR
jgi:hypothetical protein